MVRWKLFVEIVGEQLAVKTFGGVIMSELQDAFGLIKLKGAWFFFFLEDDVDVVGSRLYHLSERLTTVLIEREEIQGRIGTFVNF